MSIEVIKPCIDLPLPSEVKFTLIMLANFAHEDGSDAYPSVKRLAYICGKSERAIQMHLSKLRDLGLIQVIAWPKKPGRATHYQFNMAKIAEMAVPYVKGREDDTVDTAPPYDPVDAPRRPATNETRQEGVKPSVEDGCNPASGMGEAHCTPSTIGTIIQNHTPSSPPRGTPPALFVDDQQVRQPDPSKGMAEVWNEVCGDTLGRVIKLTSQRRQTLRKRFRDDFDGDLDRWRGYCRRIRASSFLTGDNDRGWSADFDWVLKPANLVKVVEGKYDDSRRKQVNDGWSRRAVI